MLAVLTLAHIYITWNKYWVIMVTQLPMMLLIQHSVVENSGCTTSDDFYVQPNLPNKNKQTFSADFELKSLFCVVVIIYLGYVFLVRYKV